ncbi:MAG: GNAT family N-acetyltransferase [Halanaerobiales bacterium]
MNKKKFKQKFQIREMKIDDYELMIKLWENIDGIGLSEADSRENILKYLKRNKGMSFVCELNQDIIGTIMGGHDGRRGYIYHLAVAENYRNRGIGKELLSSSLVRLREENIQKCHIFVFRENEPGNKFWDIVGWTRRNDLYVFSKVLKEKNDIGEENI